MSLVITYSRETKICKKKSSSDEIIQQFILYYLNFMRCWLSSTRQIYKQCNDRIFFSIHDYHDTLIINKLSFVVIHITIQCPHC